LPSKSASTAKISSLRRWNLVERLKTDIWRYWADAYLASCAQRSKWLKKPTELKVNDVVLLKDEILKSRDWPLAKIVAIHPGTDGVVRAVTLKCKGKTYTRASNRLVPLLTDHVEPQASPRSMSGIPDNS